MPAAVICLRYQQNYICMDLHVEAQVVQVIYPMCFMVLLSLSMLLLGLCLQMSMTVSSPVICLLSYLYVI
jgi:hypothetical protein